MGMFTPILSRSAAMSVEWHLFDCFSDPFAESFRGCCIFPLPNVVVLVDKSVALICSLVLWDDEH